MTLVLTESCRSVRSTEISTPRLAELGPNFAVRWSPPDLRYVHRRHVKNCNEVYESMIRIKTEVRAQSATVVIGQTSQFFAVIDALMQRKRILYLLSPTPLTQTSPTLFAYLFLMRNT